MHRGLRELSRGSNAHILFPLPFSITIHISIYINMYVSSTTIHQAATARYSRERESKTTTTPFSLLVYVRGRRAIFSLFFYTLVSLSLALAALSRTAGAHEYKMGESLVATRVPTINFITERLITRLAWYRTIDIIGIKALGQARYDYFLLISITRVFRTS